MFEDEYFFCGEHTCSLDAQRRVAIPSEWRKKEAASRFVLIPGRESLMLIPFGTFKEFLIKLKKVSFANRNAQKALAKIGSRVQECICDKQGRIKLSQRLLEPFGIAEQVVMVGAFTNIQLWNRESWESQQDEEDSYLDELEKLSENPDSLLDMFQDTMEKIKDN